MLVSVSTPTLMIQSLLVPSLDSLTLDGARIPFVKDHRDSIGSFAAVDIHISWG